MRISSLTLRSRCHPPPILTPARDAWQLLIYLLSMDAPILDVSYKGDPVIYGIGSVFEVHARCSTNQHFTLLWASTGPCTDGPRFVSPFLT